MPYFFYDHPIRILYACPVNRNIRKGKIFTKKILVFCVTLRYVTLQVDNFMLLIRTLLVLLERCSTSGT